MKHLVLSAAIFLATTATHANQLAGLSFDTFQITSKSMRNAGTVTVSGAKNAAGKFEKIVVEAFGKTLRVDPAFLKNIPQNANGLQLAYEVGYEKNQSKIYLIFQTGTFSTYKILVTEDGKSGVVKETLQKENE